MRQTNYPIDGKWFALGVTVIAIILLSTIPLRWAFLVLTVFGMAFVMQAHVLHARNLSRNFWLSTYLREHGSLHTFLKQSLLLPWIAWALAIPLAIITYVTVYCYDFWDCFAVGMAIASATEIHTRLFHSITPSISEPIVDLAKIRVHYWLAVALVLIFLGLTSIAKSVFIDHSQLTSDAIATRTIAEIKHPVKIVQDCARTLRYSELQLLRIRDIHSGIIGWLIYLFFLIPNSLPAFGLVTLFSGIERRLGVKR